ncbi:recombinase family protein [Nitratireductor sp. ZSWI3]|uniref:recombinase family protein n=1 Tax=Nitratireductor sp. ZSWI3 TaxID=2966359 RepID=UPI0027E3034A|nr:recombinase family protein [Nitratireductor sp. ZSWI3]
MGALYLKDLADKTRRGLRRRVEEGKSGGGNSYGYRVMRQATADGEPIRGERKVDPAEASIVRRIFQDYAVGKSPRRIAQELNAEGIPGPRGKGWDRARCSATSSEATASSTTNSMSVSSSGTANAWPLLFVSPPMSEARVQV